MRNAPEQIEKIAGEIVERAERIAPRDPRLSELLSEMQDHVRILSDERRGRTRQKAADDPEDFFDNVPV